MKSILVIDDDPDMGDALLAILQDEGYEVRLASSGARGIALAGERLPHLILLDWQMPQMGGQEVLKALKASVKLRDIPVVLLSANIANIPPEHLQSRHHLKKPFDLHLLIDLVSRILALK